MKLGKPHPTTWRKSRPQLESESNSSRKLVGATSKEGFSALDVDACSKITTMFTNVIICERNDYTSATIGHSGRSYHCEI